MTNQQNNPRAPSGQFCPLNAPPIARVPREAHQHLRPNHGGPGSARATRAEVGQGGVSEVGTPRTDESAAHRDSAGYSRARCGAQGLQNRRELDRLFRRSVFDGCSRRDGRPSMHPDGPRPKAGFQKEIGKRTTSRSQLGIRASSQ